MSLLATEAVSYGVLTPRYHPGQVPTSVRLFLGPYVRKNSSGIVNLNNPRKVDVRLPEKGKSNSHGARPVY